MAKKNKDSSDPLVIKKYANRRLYNTAEGSFVTLADLHELVKKEIAFVVQDAKTGKDLTASVLAQIVAEEENKGHNMFSPDYLRQILKLYGDGTPPELTSYLEQSISYFSENQEQMAKQFGDMLGGDPKVENTMAKWAEIGQQNMAQFQKSMETFSASGKEKASKPQSKPEPKSSPKTEPKTETNDEESEIEKLRREMAEMQARLEGLTPNK